MRGASIFLRRFRAELPRPVHFVAETPEFDTVRLLVAVRATQIGERRPAGMIAIFNEAARLVDAAHAHVDAEHRLHADLARPVDEFIGSECVGLGREPSEIQATRAPIFRADAILPVVAGEEIAAGIADDRDAELFGQVGDVLAEPLRVGGGMARLEDAGVDAPTHMLDERAKQAAVDIGNGEVGVDDEARGGHGDFHSKGRARDGGRRGRIREAGP